MHHYHWYAVYTHFNEEKLLRDYLLAQGYEVYLPERRYWETVGNKRRISYEPLFKCHLFVRTTQAGLQEVKQAPGFSHLVRHGRYLASIPESHIIKIKTILYYYEDATSIANSQVDGVTVAVVSGHLTGMTGILPHGEGERPVSMEIDHLGYSINVKVPMETIFQTKVPSLVSF